jgi:hypothetical protein
VSLAVIFDLFLGEFELTHQLGLFLSPQPLLVPYRLLVHCRDLLDLGLAILFQCLHFGSHLLLHLLGEVFLIDGASLGLQLGHLVVLDVDPLDQLLVLLLHLL